MRFKNRLGYVVTKVKPEFWIDSKAETKPVLLQFFNNVQYLIDCRGLSQEKVSKGIFDRYGFSASREAISRFRTNETFVNAELSYLAAFSLYFQEPLIKLLSVDYEKEAKEKAGESV